MYERRVFFPTMSSVSAARHWAAPLLRDRYGVGIVEDALLCISELAANAVQHAGTAYEVRLRADAGSLRISVLDDAVAVEPPGATGFPAALVESGRGLAIIDSISESSVAGTDMPMP